MGAKDFRVMNYGGKAMREGERERERGMSRDGSSEASHNQKDNCRKNGRMNANSAFTTLCSGANLKQIH